MSFLSPEYRLSIRSLALAALLTLGACNTQPAGKPEASRAEATRLGAKVYSVEIASANSARAVRFGHDVWMQIWTNDRQAVAKGQSVILDEQRFSLSGHSQGVNMKGQPTFEVHGFVEPVADKPGRATLNMYQTVIQNPDQAFENRVSLENAAGSLPTRESTEVIMGRLLPAIAQNFGRATAQAKIDLLVPAPHSIARLSPARDLPIMAIETHYANGDFAKLIAAAQPLAQAGNPIAQRALGYALANGAAGRARVAEGIDWLKRAADQGDTISRAAMLINGLGMPADVSSGVALMRAEAARGDLHALFLLGEMADAGGAWGPPDTVMAAKLFATAARYGFLPAQLRMGRYSKTVVEPAQEYAAEWPKL